MANKKQLGILRKGVEFWNQWREENPRARIDLEGAELATEFLSSVNLRGADLQEAQLQGAYLLKANLQEANLISADLDGADLTMANIHRANLHGANLCVANLLGATLLDADLQRANLRKANLKGAQLYEADLHGADLCGGSLWGTQLQRANFQDACLEDVNFEGAVFFATILGNSNLVGAKHLEKCEHRGPSTIDLKTIQRSWPLPEVFLRGCGLPDDFIRYIPEFLNQPFQFYSCFISHSGVDKAFARRLYDALQGRGIRCWLDEHQMQPGDDLHDAIAEGIRLWDKVLLCSSKASLTSWWVDNEIDNALQKEQKLMSERGKKVYSIIPLDLDGYMFEPAYESGKKAQLLKRLAADFKGWKTDNDKFEAGLERVIKALKLGGREKPPVPRL
jgi:uncharacterized protein YjbI with pentapeptide repeats